MGKRTETNQVATTEPATKMATADEWDAVVDQAADFYLGITGDDFRARLAAGEFDDPDNGPDGLMSVLALLPEPAAT